MGRLEDCSFQPMGSLDLVILICFLSYLEWMNRSMCKNNKPNKKLFVDIVLAHYLWTLFNLLIVQNFASG